MPTVLIATGIMNAGGAETLIMEQLRHHASDIQYIMFIHHNGAIKPGVYDNEIRSLGVPIVYIPSVGYLGIKQYISLFKEKVQLIGKVDILHSHLNAVGGVIAKAAKEAGIKNRIIHCHADITFTGSNIRILLNEAKLAFFKVYVNKYGTAFWACSQAAGRRLFAVYKRFAVIPNIIDVEKYLLQKGQKISAKSRIGLAESFVIGSIGRIAPIKNYELCLQILSDLKKRGVIADFVCYGRVVDEAYFQKLTDLAKSLDIWEQVHFMGNSIDVPSDIAAFDVFLMPSISEGFGMAAIEAQAAGIPTIVSTGVPQIVDVGLGIIKFVGLDTSKWIDAVIDMKEVGSPDNESIIEAFIEHGYNSPFTVSKIESEYKNMVMEG